MPTPKNKYDREHLRRIEAIKRQIDAIYAEAVKEAAALGVTIDMPQDAEKPFSFDDYPKTEKQIEELMAWLRGQLEATVVNGIKAEWALSNDKNDAMVTRVFGSGFGDLPEDVRSLYLSTNDAAREAFIQRKRNGLGLSDYVWRYADGFKDEIEMGLDLGIREGKDAPAMARDLKQYLRHPDMLFRRVRDEHGMLHLSKRAAAFHPGRGVYRSSYLNARRLAATETNIAYRTADHERWKQMDFVVGIEIHLSNNHTCKGRDGKPHKFDDICDQLQGKYPKDFKFTGWHPHCRCFATSILKTDEEIAEDTKKMLRGEPVTGESENAVDDVPEGFKDWMEKNEERMAEASKKGTLPYWVKDNENLNRQVVTNPSKTYLGDVSVGEIGIVQISKEDRIFMNNTFNEIQSKLNIFAPGTYFSTGEMDGGVVMECLPGMVRVTRVKYLLEDGTVFSPAEELLSAMKKLKSSEVMTFNEEYMIESLYHESVHSITGVEISKLERNTIHERLMETCNQLYARNNYTAILKAYNVDAKNYDKIQLQGICYQRECAALRKAFFNGSTLDDDLLLKYANRTKNIYDFLKYLGERGMTKEEIQELMLDFIG